MLKKILTLTLIIISLQLSAARYGVSIGTDVNIRSSADLFAASLGKIEKELQTIEVLEITKQMQEITIHGKKIKAPWAKIKHNDKVGFVFSYFIRSFEYKTDADKFIKMNQLKRKEYTGKYIFRDKTEDMYSFELRENGTIKITSLNKKQDISEGEGRIYIDPIIGELFFYANMLSHEENENALRADFEKENPEFANDDKKFAEYLASQTKKWRLEISINIMKALDYFFPYQN
jgi:hypothetical protein